METKVEHTKGPWEVTESDRNGQAIVRAEHYEIATCWHHSVKSIEREMEANARLIAAAPEMLEALESLPLNAFGEDMGNCDAADFVDHSGEFFEAMIKARAAIRKATGNV